MHPTESQKIEPRPDVKVVLCESGCLRPGSSTTRAPQRQRRIKGSFVLYPFLRPTYEYTSVRAATSNHLASRLGIPNFLSLDRGLTRNDCETAANGG
eukprot:COSAG06_NODE_3400_length_5395_cov_78.114992_3_plen_97_part_00